ncbi:MAG: hypothetical protein IPF93_14855 [Saprospiraceae bacterium]|nr:hypothetical protein [Saprospiraceae bacterium]
MLRDKCNISFGEGIDVSLQKQIPLGSLMDVKRDRGSAPKLDALNSSGERYTIDPKKREAEIKPGKPREFIDEHGEQTFEVKGSAGIKAYLKARRKEYPDLTDDQFNKKVLLKQDPHDEVFTPELHGLKPLNGADAYRAIAKIAINYYVHLTDDFSMIHDSVDFVKNKTTITKERVFNYYKQSRDELGLFTDEVSHVLYLEGNYAERMLFCYIELYNVYCFVIVLNYDYDGPDIKNQHRLNVINRQVINELISTNLTFDEVRKLQFPGVNIDGFKERLFQFGDITGLEFRVLNN